MSRSGWPCADCGLSPWPTAVGAIGRNCCCRGEGTPERVSGAVWVFGATPALAGGAAWPLGGGPKRRPAAPGCGWPVRPDAPGWPCGG